MIILAAGGTGGHVSPALAIANALGEQGKPFHFVADQRTAKMIPPAFPQTILNIPPPSAGKKQQLRAVYQAVRLLKPLVKQAEKVACFGGYPAFPAGVAAIINRKPLIIQEQNAVMGKSNRVLARFAKHVALSYPETLLAPKRNCTVTGNPVHAAIKAEPYPPVNDKTHLLVTGGSLGASIFSEVVPAAFKQMSEEERQKYAVTQQCRQEDIAAVQGIYDQLNMPVTLKSFFDDLPQQMAQAHLVICRAGASTLAELLIIGRPAIFVPYPHAAHDHQTRNAEIIANNHKGYRTVAQPDFEPEKLLKLLREIKPELSVFQPPKQSAETAVARFIKLLD